MTENLEKCIDKNRVISHRGDNTNYPENTYAAVEAALLAGAKFVEFDVQMNADKSIILFHDEDFKRMSNKKLSVFDLTDKDLNAISIHEPEQFKQQHFPTYTSYLEEVVTLLTRFPGATFIIEIKPQSLEHWGISTVLDKLLPILKQYSKNLIIISYSLGALEYVRKHSHIKIGLVFNLYLEKHKNIADRLNPDFMVCPYSIIPDTTPWKGPWEWMVYTINDVKLAKEWLARDEISFIETDDINLLLI